MKISELLELGNNSVDAFSEIEIKSLVFRGQGNRLLIKGKPNLKNLNIEFDCNYGVIEIGTSNLKGRLRVGEHSAIFIGDEVTVTNRLFLTTAEGGQIKIGNDVMFAADVSVRGDDSHPIFDVKTEKRINWPRDIVIGEHVWIGDRATILSGAHIMSGSVVGANSVVKKKLPNNCIAVGVPAKVIRKNVAWERPHLTRTKPYMKPDSNSIIKSGFWEVTKKEKYNSFFFALVKKIIRYVRGGV